MPSTSHSSSRGAHRRARRVSREQAIVSATRELFDQRGIRDARVDDIARVAGLNKALIYRAFSSKDEIFVLTATSYLDELRAGTDAVEPIPDAGAQLRGVLTVFADFCVSYPAFLDCGLALLRRPALELRETLSTRPGFVSPVRLADAWVLSSVYSRPAWSRGFSRLTTRGSPLAAC